MKRTTQLVSALALGVFLVDLAAADTWTRKADMPTARTGLSTSALDGKIYAIGGRLSWGGNKTSIVEQYDPATDTWTGKAPMPTPRRLLSACAVNGKIYAIGGRDAVSKALSTVEEYDPATDTWTAKADMPTRRSDICAAATNGRIYVFGGSGDDGMRLAIVEEYDPVTDTWTRKANMPTVRSAPSASAVDGKIYVIGGFTGPVGESARIYNTVEQYDPETDSWATNTPMAIARAAFATSAVYGKIYAFSGTPFTTYYSTVEEYDVVTDTWTYKANIPTARSNFGASEVNGKIYVIGGMTWGYAVISTVEEYDTGLSRSPDFNGDFVIDIKDLLMLIEYWGGNEPAFDVAPPPSGDGVIDAQDLEVFMGYWGQELDDPRLQTHWTLDEAAGLVAADSAGACDGTLAGDPVWQPVGGKLGGALLFDGIDDYVTTEYVRDPAEGPFSVFAWIKGGAPGQVVVSQANGVNWLMADPAQGLLMTELKGAARLSRALCSQSVITDGTWHRVGLVWDGSNRILYVDDIEVARDTQSSLVGTYAGLHIGAGKALEPGSFFSGLIDDVRIYNRAVHPQ